MRNLILAGGVLLAAAGAAQAQQAFSIPQSPAFTYLDVSPTKVERPTTAREFGSALQNGIDENGKVVQGFALDAAPWTLFPKVSIPAEKYNQRGAYMLANLSLSLGTARAAGDTASTAIALGVRTTVYDDADPMADPAFRAEIRKGISQCNLNAAGDASDDAVHACAAQLTAAARKRWLGQHWNDGSLSFAAAAGVKLRSSQLDSADFAGVSAWGAWALRLASSGQLLVQARVDQHAASGAKDAFTSIRTGARAVMGSENANGFLEVEHNSKTSAGATTGWSGGVEFKASDDLWLSTGFGKGYAPSKKDKVVLLANIRWRVTSKATMSPR